MDNISAQHIPPVTTAEALNPPPAPPTGFVVVDAGELDTIVEKLTRVEKKLDELIC